MAVRRGEFPGAPSPSGRPGAVARAFRALPAAHREILTETWFRRRTVDQAAAVLGLPVEDVKLRVYQALRALAVALDG
ncbi:sigma factor-like helix-turn-helix DNA-binding protein [Actinomadura rupiterrae]|uniref:sigma factor-like helix-turn-helix DNA-binding protein n=1 Tax=Actinomadura rupiterrae TaxID=559627 RepID=UPI0020A4188C|nr:sigma factor-like helix-turn-helix DNA-binding protein [Actinomadura rupiterrae]MCP2335923.1 DNA-directed RNA polymerase specialized sigma24 family protein [Actinomadura rupiterrae]